MKHLSINIKLVMVVLGSSVYSLQSHLYAPCCDHATLLGLKSGGESQDNVGVDWQVADIEKTVYHLFIHLD